MPPAHPDVRPKGDVVVPHQLFSFAEEAMGVHVDGLDAFAVHTYRQALPASLLCAGRVERRATAKSNAGRCGRAFKGTTRLARATPERQKPKRSRPRPRPPRPPPGASCGDRQAVVRVAAGAPRPAALASVKSPTVIDGIRPRKSGSHQPPPWRGSHE